MYACPGQANGRHFVYAAVVTVSHMEPMNQSAVFSIDGVRKSADPGTQTLAATG